MGETPVAHTERRHPRARGLKAVVKRSKWLAVASRIAAETGATVRGKVPGATRNCGATHAGFSLDDSLAYVDAVYGDYLRYGGFGAADLEGSSVLELGPGDNFGVALRLIAAGAERVVALDRFVSWRDDAQQRQIYDALLDRMDDGERARADGAIEFDREGNPHFDGARLQVVEGVPIESATELLGRDSFDFVVSRAVLEHVYDTRTAFAAMDALLRPGGTMAHKVDLRDHGMFTQGDQHPLTFLTIPGFAYRLMGERSGIPNRWPVRRYREDMEALGYETTILVTHVVGRDDELVPHRERLEPGEIAAAREVIDQIRPALLSPYRELPDEELAVAGLFLTARKPG